MEDPFTAINVKYLSAYYKEKIKKELVDKGYAELQINSD